MEGLTKDERRAALQFAKDVLTAWGCYIVEEGKYKTIGLDYADALAEMYCLRNDPLTTDANYQILVQMQTLLTRAKYLVELERQKQHKEIAREGIKL